MKAITHYKDRIGQKFGRMTIIAYEPIKHRGRYVCQCECGIIKSVDCSQLIDGRIKSCGCLSKELLVQRVLKFVKNGKTILQLLKIGHWRMVIPAI